MSVRRKKEYAQIGDYISSYRGALEQSDGSTYWLLSHDAKDSGLRIDHELFYNSMRYKLSFDIEKITGDLLVIGGRLDMAHDIMVTVDGSFETYLWDHAPMCHLLNDGERHRVMIDFTVNDRYDPLQNNFLFIIPNKGLDLGYNVLIRNIDLEEVMH